MARPSNFEKRERIERFPKEDSEIQKGDRHLKAVTRRLIQYSENYGAGK
jgi:hypothetical protein